MLLESYHAQQFHGVILLAAGLSEFKLAYSTREKQDCLTASGFFIFFISGRMFVQDVLIKMGFISKECIVNWTKKLGGKKGVRDC